MFTLSNSQSCTHELTDADSQWTIKYTWAAPDLCNLYIIPGIKVLHTRRNLHKFASKGITHLHKVTPRRIYIKFTSDGISLLALRVYFRYWDEIQGQNWSLYTVNTGSNPQANSSVTVKLRSNALALVTPIWITFVCTLTKGTLA